MGFQGPVDAVDHVLELKRRAETAEAERDRLRDRLHGCLEERNAVGLGLMGALMREISDTVEGVDELIAERNRLRDAVQRHREDMRGLAKQGVGGWTRHINLANQRLWDSTISDDAATRR